MTTRVLLAHPGGLLRGALASVLAREHDIEVIAQSSHGDNLLDLVARVRPHIAVLDFDLPATASITQLCERLSPLCIVLIMADRRAEALKRVDVARLAPRLGLIAKESPASVFIDGVRRAMHGEPVIDAELARAALTAEITNPLTGREQEVLRLAEAGLTTRAIAGNVHLSQGTVRNYLSRVITKTGGRTRLEAIRIAQKSGWI
jgi:two-component system, NarL family, response regulator DesR